MTSPHMPPAPIELTTTLAVPFHRIRRHTGQTFAEEPPPPVPRPLIRARPARVAVKLALAHQIQAALDVGALQSQAEVAERLGITPARVTYLLNLLLLAPDLQHRVLFLETPVGRRERITEAALRAIAHLPLWDDQRRAFAELAARVSHLRRS